MKIQKLKIFVLPKQEVLEEIGNFLLFKFQEQVLESPRNFQFLGFRKSSK
mgnify:CR=1 FL=1